jgi:hypothetical protein
VSTIKSQHLLRRLDMSASRPMVHFVVAGCTLCGLTLWHAPEARDVNCPRCLALALPASSPAEAPQ